MIEKYRQLLKAAEGNKFKMENVFDRIRAKLASSVLARDFNESVEQYLEGKPELKKLHEWAQKIEISKDYKIVSI